MMTLRLYAIIFFLFLTSINQELFSSSRSNLYQKTKNKAESFFKKAEYDSAIVYYLKTRNLSVNEIDKLNDLIKVSNIYRIKRNFDSSLYYIDLVKDGLRLNKNSYPDIEYEILHLQGTILLNQGEYSEALNYLSEAIDKRLSIVEIADTLMAKSFNNIGNCYFYLGNNQLALNNYIQALNLAKQKKSNYNDKIGTYYQNVGIIYARLGDFDKALENFNKNLEINLSILTKTDPAIARIYLNLGRIYSIMSQYDKALDLSKSAKDIYLERFGADYSSLGLLYLNMGAIYYQKSNHDEAELYYNNALRIYRINYKGTHPNIGRIYNNLGLLFFSRNQFDKSLEYYKKSLDIAVEPRSIIINLRNIAGAYLNLNNLEQAGEYYKFAITKAESSFNQPHYELGQSYRRYGEFLLSTKKLDEAYEFFQLSLNVFDSIFPQSNVYSSEVYRLMGDCFFEKDSLHKALDYYQQALIFNDFTFKDKALDTNPDISNALSPGNYITILFKKARALALLGEAEKNDDLFLESLECYRLAMDGYEDLKSNVGEDSKLLLANETRKSFDLSFSILNDLYHSKKDESYVEEAFSFAEKGKSSVLLAAMKDVDAMKFSGIPEELQEVEKELKEKIAGYESLVYNEKNKSRSDSAKISLWDHKLFVLDQQHDSLLDQFEENYPSYYSLKHNTEVSSIADVQEALDQDQVLIEYVLTDSLLFRFAITPDEAVFNKVPIDSSFFKDVDALRYANKIDFSTHGKKEFKAFVLASNRLYQTLFKNLGPLIEQKKLVIVPDGKLGYLPFESLVTELPDFEQRIDYRNLNYLLRKSPVSYSYSSTLLLRGENRRSYAKSLIAFAPEYENEKNTPLYDESRIALRETLEPLLYAQEEVNTISQIFKGDVFSGETANESNFKSIAEDHGIIHLAMHTVLDDENPMHSKLVFSSPADSIDDGYLNTYEIYGLELNAQLAVLSACNTGSGKINRGEGIMSLSRGFIYAGVPSIVMTLWEVEDKSGSTIMSLFYENLKKGMHKDEALQKAKIDYLDNAPQLRAHPYFWAAYVDIGNTEPLKSHFLSAKMIYLFLAGLFIAIVVFIYLRNKKKLPLAN